MAQEVRLALQVAERFSIQYEQCHARLWFPRVTLSWLGVPPGSFVYDDPGAVHSVYNTNSDDSLNAIDHTLPPGADTAEWRQGLREVHDVHVRRAALKAARLNMSFKEDDARSYLGIRWWHSVSTWFEETWSGRRSLILRLRFWRFLRRVRHSSHLRHALKNAFGVVILTFPAFMPESSSSKRETVTGCISRLIMM